MVAGAVDDEMRAVGDTGGEEARRKAAAWDALVALLPRLGEWQRGAVLAADGRLLDWVLRNDPRETRGPR